MAIAVPDSKNELTSFSESPKTYKLSVDTFNCLQITANALDLETPSGETSMLTVDPKAMVTIFWYFSFK